MDRKIAHILSVVVVMLFGGFVQAVQHYTYPDNASLNLPFSDAVRVDNLVYVSGQLGDKFGSAPTGGNC